MRMSEGTFSHAAVQMFTWTKTYNLKDKSWAFSRSPFINVTALNFTILWPNAADDKLMIFSYCSQKRGILYLMQIVSNGGNLHEMSKPV